MHIHLSFEAFFISLAGGIGTLQVFHLLFSKRENVFANRILAFFLLAILFVNLLNWLSLVQLMADLPYLFRSGRPLSYLFAPLLYLYLRACLYKENKFRKGDWIFFLPVILVYFEYTPFYLSPTLYKIQCIIKAEATGIDMLDGLLIGKLHGFIFIMFDLFYGYLIFRLISIYQQANISITLEEKRIIRWVKHLVIISLIVLVVFIFFWFAKVDAHRILTFYFLQNSIVVYFVSTYLLIVPSILNGTYTDEKTGKKEDAIKTAIITAEKFLIYESIINKLVIEEKVYLGKKLTLKSLSEKSGISIHHLSAFINKKYSMSFNDFINKMRIDYVIEKLSSGEWKKYSLEGLAMEAGFASRTSFFSSFKKFTNTSPTDYIKRLKHSESNSFILRDQKTI